MQTDSVTGPGQVDADVSMAWATVDRLIDGFLKALPLIGIALILFGIAWLVARGVRGLILRSTRNREGANLGQVLGRLAYAGILLLGVLIAVMVVVPSVTPGSLFAALGLGGVAIGFAFQDIFENLLAGILILLREPFKVGDEIVSGEFTGTVETIETRATFLRTYDGRRIIIPNSVIYTEAVSVITAYGRVRSEYDVGIGYGDDIAHAKQVALDTMKAIDGILDEPAPDVLTWDLAGSSVNLRLRWWSKPDRGSVVNLRDRVLHAVKDALSDAGIDLPFPTQVVLLHDQTEETDGDRTRQREGWPAGNSPPRSRTIAGAIREGSSGHQAS